MRALGALLVVAGMTTAYAHPVRILKDPFRPRYDACNTAKSWSKLTTCLARQGQKVTILHQAEGAKLVALRYASSADAQLSLYMFDGGMWTQQAFYATTNANNELLLFKHTAQTGYRIDVGMSVWTSVQLDDVSPMPAVLRRIASTECRRGRGCRTMVISCDVFVEGKTYWFFRGRLVWGADGNVKVSGDTRFAGKLCTPPAAFLTPIDDELGDPLE